VQRQREIICNGGEIFFNESNGLMAKHLGQFVSRLKRALTVDNNIRASDEGVA
jgi:hypothetical protein